MNPVPPPPQQVPAPSGVAPLLSSIIHERTGLLFEPHQHPALLAKLQPLAQSRQCPSFLDYYYLLKYEDHGSEDWDSLLDALCVPETYFWREMSQIHAVVQTLVPRWFQSASQPLRVWSAASAGGEEAYSLLIALHEAGLDHYPIHIIASDVSPAALRRAHSGVYPERAFRALPPALREKYFLPAPRGGRILPSLASRMQFQRVNLMAPSEFHQLARSQIIFCRNVFLYFSPHAIRQTVAAFAARMPRRAHLFVGASESLLRMTADFELAEINGAFAYVKT